MTKLIRNIGVAALFGATLAACGGGGGNDAAPAAPPVVVPPAARVEDGFGANFGIAFRADPNSEPRDYGAGDIIPLSLTAEPTAI